MIPLLAIKALAAAAAMAALAYAVHRLDTSRQQIGYDRAQGEQAAAALKATAENFKVKELQDAKVIAAQNQRSRTEQDLRLAADGARSELDGLRNDLAASRRDLPAATCDAVRARAAALETVFEQCASSYSGMAQAAGGHAADTVMFEKAWPK